ALDVAQPTSATILDERPGVPRRRRRRCSATNPGFRQQRSPPDMGLKGFTWVQNQFPKPDTSAGHIAVTAIPGPKPVSTSAILVALLFCQGEAGGQGLVSWSPALRLQVSAAPPACQCPGDTPRLRCLPCGAHARSPQPRRRSGDDHP